MKVLCSLLIVLTYCITSSQQVSALEFVVPVVVVPDVVVPDVVVPLPAVAVPAQVPIQPKPSYGSSQGRNFAGINFGVGISLTRDTGSHDRVETAFIDENNIVRVSKNQNDIARIMLESHYFFEPRTSDFSFMGLTKGINWGHGPFISLQPGTDEIIEAIGIGWMVGFRRGGDDNSSLNLGIGYIIDPSVQVLGDGINENMPLPQGESQIRFKDTSQSGIMFIASFTF